MGSYPCGGGICPADPNPGADDVRAPHGAAFRGHFAPTPGPRID